MLGYTHEELVLGNLLETKAARNKGRTFLRFRDTQLTYDEVNELANRIARGLSACGVSRGQHVAVMLPNCPEFLSTTFALAKLGAVSVPINTAYKGELLRHVLKTSDARMLVVDEAWLGRVVAVEHAVSTLGKVVVRGRDAALVSKSGLAAESIDFRRLLDHPAKVPDEVVRFGDLQAIMYTSGTTGPSKGVMIPHAHSLTCALDWIRYTAYQAHETIYCPLPLFHGGALWDGVMSALLADSQIAIVERFSASQFWDDVRHFRAHVTLGIFALIPILLNKPPTPDDKNHSLRCFYLGQSALDERLYERFGVHAVETYASTEVGVATGSPYGEWQPGSCGQVNGDTYAVQVVDELDRELPPDEPGEMVIRPVKPFAMSTDYYNFPRETVEAFRNLWFHTGDRVYRDKDGYFFFVDRLSDTIRRRGENLSSFEVERAVNSHPAVLESAAIAVPAEVGEDEVKICVVSRPGAKLEPEELITYCDDRLPYFMVPRYVEFYDEFPKTPIGKIKKAELRRAGDRGITSTAWDREKAGYKLKRA